MTLQNHLAAATAGGLLLVAGMSAVADDGRGGKNAAAATHFCAGAGQVPGCPKTGPRSFRVGDIAPPGQLHRITAPGLYGLSDPPTGDAYGVLDGELVRLDAATGQILSVLFPVPRILD